MGRSSIDRLPPEVREAVRQALYQRGFGGYVALSEELAAQGHVVSKSALHRYGRKLEAAMKREELSALYQVARAFQKSSQRVGTESGESDVSKAPSLAK